MYTNHFGFEDVPFTQLADPRHVFVSAQFEEVRSELVEALRDQARVVLLTGNAGTGKTKLLSHMRALLEEKRPVFYLPYSALMIEDFIEYAAGTMRMDFAAGQDIFESFQEGLSYIAEGGSRPILLIDDGHNLGADVLENLIGLFRLGPGDVPLAQLVIAAHPEIDYLLERSELRELEENLARLSRMQPLERKEVGSYIDFALRIIGYEGPSVFTADALEAVAGQTHGVPELINGLCGAAFVLAAKKGENPVTLETVNSAVSDVAALSMVDTIETERQVAHEEDWYLDFDDVESPAPKLPGIVQAWLKRSRRWPIAAVGIGGSVALTALLVLLGTLPFDENSAEANQRNLNAELSAQVEQLREKMIAAEIQRERLEAEIDARVSERDELAEKLAELESRVLAEQGVDAPHVGEQNTVSAGESSPVVVTALEDASPASDLDSAEALLAELMASAEREAEVVTGKMKKGEQSAPVTVVKPVSKTQASPSGSYVVQKGDTVWSIAQSHNTTVESVLASNAMADASALRIGQVLTFGEAAAVGYLPEQDPQGQRVAVITAAQEWHVVEPGDSLFGIGRKFAASVEELREWNALGSSEEIYVGQRIRLVPNIQ